MSPRPRTITRLDDAETLWTIPTAARLLMLSPRTVRHRLYERPDLFDQPRRYTRVGKHPRKHRALTLRDLRTVASLGETPGVTDMSRKIAPGS